MNVLGSDNQIERIIQESVPGKQVTIAHVIAAPMQDVYDNLNMEPQGAIGILTLTPCETSIIAADIATKAATVKIAFLDRSTGSLIITGDVQSTESALIAITTVLRDDLGFATVPVTKT
jgi:ethanolamine utilization protein EutS